MYNESMCITGGCGHPPLRKSQWDVVGGDAHIAPVKVYLTTEHTACETERQANEMMLMLLREKSGQHNIVMVDDMAEADIAIMIASRLYGTGFEAYHQVTDDWDRYMASYRLASELQKQVQRYQLVYKRKPKAGVVGAFDLRTPEIDNPAQWLKRMPIPAVVCEYYLNGTLDRAKLQAQVSAYGKAIEEFVE